MKKLSILLAVMFSVVSVNLVMAQSDPAAKSVLDAVSSKFKTFKAVQSSFSLQVEDGNGKAQGVKKGTVYMKEGK